MFLFRAFQDVGVRRVGYSQWKEMLASGSFERVVVGPDWVRGYPKPAETAAEAEKDKSRGQPGLPYVATRIAGDDSLVKQIESSKVEYDAPASAGSLTHAVAPSTRSKTVRTPGANHSAQRCHVRASLVSRCSAAARSK